MVLSRRSFANIESVKDDDVRDVIRILYDRIHDLESRAERKVAPTLDADGEKFTNLADATDPGDAVSLEFADHRYEPFHLSNIPLENSAVTKLVALGLTEAEARRLIT